MKKLFKVSHRNPITKILLSFALTFIFTTGAQAFYQDVPEDHLYHQEIKTLENLDLLPKANLFNPDKTATKGEFYELLLTYGQAELSDKIDLPFNDTLNTHPQARFLQTAIDLRLIPVFNNQTFGADFGISKHQALNKIFTALGVGQSAIKAQGGIPFTDVNPKAFFAPTAHTAAQFKIFSHHDPLIFQAFKNVTKGEIAYFLHQIHTQKPQLENKTIIIETPQTKQQSPYPIFDNVWGQIQKDYLKSQEINKQELEHSAIQGLINSLKDPYSSFEKPQMAEDFLTSLQSSLTGIGIIIERIDNKITIVSPLKDSPAEKAGLKPNDIITKVDKIDVTEKSVSEIARLIKGPIGTKVEIEILRNNQTKTFTIQRDLILISSVFSEIKNNIAIIQITNFNQSTHQEFKQELEKIIPKNPKGYIIDLRNNPGGYLYSAVNILGHFIETPQTATKFQNNKNQIEEIIATTKTPQINKKVIVLINEGSASASEILAGALKDHGIAKIIGTKSFGKGTAQSLIEYIDGSLLKLTTSKWVTPLGTVIDQIGITPDIEIKDPNKQLNQALTELSK